MVFNQIFSLFVTLLFVTLLDFSSSFTVYYFPNTTCGNEEILIGTNTTFDVHIPNNSVSWVLLFINGTEMQNYTSSFEYTVQFNEIGPTLVSVSTSNKSYTWNTILNVIELISTDILISPIINGTIESTEDIAILFNSTCVIYNEDSLYWKIDDQIYSTQILNHSFGLVPGNTTLLSKIKLLYPLDIVLTQRTIAVQNSIMEFRVKAEKTEGCVNDQIPITFTLSQGTDVTYTFHGKSINNTKHFLTLPNNGNNLIIFSANNTVSSATFSLSFDIATNITATLSTTLLMTGQTLRGEITSHANDVNWYVTGPNSTAWNVISSQDVLTHHFISPGEFKLMAALGNQNSQCNKRWIVTVYVPSEPTLEFISSLIPTELNTLVTVSVNIFNNSKESELNWHYNEIILDNCTMEKIEILPNQRHSCTLNNNNQGSLEVKLISPSLSTYNYSKTISHITTFKIGPQVIQVGTNTSLWISMYNGSVWCNTWADSEVTTTCQPSYYFYKMSTGESNPINVKVFNAITAPISKTFTLTVVDIGKFWLCRTDTQNVGNKRLVALSGVDVELQIKNDTLSTYYNWTVIEDDEVNITSWYPHKNSTLYFSDYLPEINAEIKNCIVIIKANLYDGPSYTKNFTIYIYQEISNIVNTIISNTMLINKQYDFNITWYGTAAHCFVMNFTKISDINISIPVNVTQYQTHCNIAFTTPSEPENVVLNLEIGNLANKVPLTYRFFLYNLVKNFSISYSEVIVPNEKFTYNVTSDIPDTQFRWVISNNSGFNHVTGYGAMVNAIITDSIYRDDYTLTVTGTGPLFLNGTLSKNYPIRVATKELYLRISQNMMIQPSIFGGLNLTVSIGRNLPDTEFTWFILEQTDEEIGVFQKLDSEDNSTTYVIDTTKREGLYTFKLRAAGKWIYGSCYENSTDFTSQCVEQNITFLLCNPTVPVIAGGVNRTLFQSLWFNTEVSITSTCVVKYEWSIDCSLPNDVKCGSSSNSYQPKMLPGLTPQFDTPSLELPPHAFESGLYRINCKLSIDGVIINNITVNLNVSQTLLIPLISGGMNRAVGFNDTIKLDASPTIDPCVKFQEKAVLYYRWVLNETSCFVNQAGSLLVHEWSIENKILVAMENCFYGNELFDAMVYVKRNSLDQLEMEQFYSQKVEILVESVPQIQLVCHTCNVYMELKYNLKIKSKFIASCTNCDSTMNLIFQWTVKGLKDANEIELNSKNTFSPPGVNILVLAPNILDGKQPYLIEVSVSGLSSKGKTNLILQPNKIPENGTCVISPNQGLALETEFRFQCLNWEDEDNVDNPFIYLIFAGTSKMMISRSSFDDMMILLPPGDNENNWKLPLEIWIQDSLGGYAEVLVNNVIVKQPNVLYPSRAVLKLFDKNIDSKNLNGALGISNGISVLMSPLSDDEKSTLYNILLKKIVTLNTCSPDTTQQLLQALSVPEQDCSLQTTDKQTRESILTSLIQSFSLVKAFSQSGLTLTKFTEDSFVYLFSRNLEYGAIGNKLDSVDPNYAYIQNLYNLVLSTSLTGENSVTYTTVVLSATIQRADGSKIYQEENQQNENTNCYISYNIPEIEVDKDVFKISECSKINPFSDIQSKSSIVSLTFKKNRTHHLELNNLQKPVVLDIPTNVKLLNRLKLKLKYGSLITKTLQGIPAPLYGGWSSSALLVVVEIIEATGDGNIFLHLSHGIEPVSKDLATINKTIVKNSAFSSRSIFIHGSDYERNDTYFLGLEHDYFTGYIRVELTIYITSCHFWNVKTQQWDGVGCKPINTSTEKNAQCQCNHLTSFTSGISVVPNQIDFSVLKSLDIENNPVALITVLVVIFTYIIIVFMAYGKDQQEKSEEHVIPFVGSDEGFFQYEIRIKTGMYPFSGTTAKVAFQLFGTKCVTKGRVFKTDTSFQRNALDIFRIGLDQSIGKVHKIRIWHDNTGENPSWYVERVVIRSLVNGEKYFFFCNQWIGADSGNGKLEYEFHVANKDEMQKFSTIFYDTLSRGFNDLHMWLSFFEKPKFSKFSRVQRATCMLTLILTWMAVNAMWFQASKTEKNVLNVGWTSISLEELLFGFINVFIVFPINIIFYLLFRKSRQKKLPTKKLKIWKKPRRIYLEFVDLENIKLVEVKNSSDSDDKDDAESEQGSFIRRGRRCLNIHKLLQKEQNLELSMNIPTSVHGISSTTFSSPSSYRTLKLPHSFDENTEISRNQFQYFEEWKVQHLDWFRKKRENSPTLHAASCMSLKRTPEDLKEKNRRTHSVGSLRHLILEGEEKELPECYDDFNQASRVHMTNINEKAPSAYYDLSHADESEWLLSDYDASRLGPYQTKLSAQIRKNETLAKKLQIPKIIELDLTTRWTLPHWCIYIGYFSCFAVSGFACIVVLTYGQQFGYPLALKWLKSLVFGFIEDFFIAYPIFIILFAIVSALFIKPLDLDNIDHIDFVICESGKGQSSSAIQSMPPLTDVELESAHEEAIRRTRLRNFIKYVLQQCFLLFLLLIICTGVFSHTGLYESNYQLKRNVMSSLVNVKSADSGVKINEASWSQYWKWLETTVLEFIYDDFEMGPWNLISPLVVYQLRGELRDCITSEYLTNNNKMKCKQRKYVKWVSNNHWNMHTIEEDFLTTYNSTENYYQAIGHEKNSPGGYKWRFRRGTLSKIKSSTLQSIQRVKRMKWIDENTLSVSHKFLLYNEGSNTFAFLNVLIDAKDSGYHDNTFQLHFFSKYDYLFTGFQLLVIFCILTMFVVVLTTWWRKTRIILSKLTLPGFWFFHSMLLIIATISLFTRYIRYLIAGREFEKSIVNGLTTSDGLMKEFVDKHEFLKSMAAMVSFLVILRCVKFFLLSSIYHQCSRKLAGVWFMLFQMIIFHVIILTMVSHSSYLFFHNDEYNYKTLKDTYLTLAFYWWIPDAKNSRSEPRKSHFGYFLHFTYTLYYIFFVFNWLKILFLISKRFDQKKTVNESKAGNDDVDIVNVVSYIWNTFKERDRKVSKHVHFQTQVSIVNEYTQETPATTYSTIYAHQEPLPPLPFCLEEMSERLISALGDIDNIISIDGWEREFYSHYQRVFSKHTNEKAAENN